MAKEKTADIQEELEQRFLTYALSTIVSRSLPDVRDGLKPIHRRVLFAIDQMGVTATAKHVKSAKIIGEVLGKYHPHGDSSTYDSMVRMAQDFSMRYPLVDGKGNFGSLDGDPPAAYRYTEGRLTPITSYLLNDIKKDTVEFKLNYDNTLKEPVVLPSRVPNLLVNGSSGIAVGMACSFPSHNLKEVISALTALIDDPDLTVAQLMKFIKGPDFPTGALILNSKAELRASYEEGQGAIKIRGEWMLEDLPRGKQQVVITSIPYGVNKARLIEKIAEIILSKKLPPLLDVRDESDKEVRVVLEIKSGAEPEKIMSYVTRHTELETNFQINFNCLKPDGSPGRLSLLEICRYFLDFRKEVVIRRLNHELALLEKRLHILAAFVAIFRDLDKALKLIRSSSARKEAHDKLKKAFDLDDEQTSAILEIPLYRLVSMEIDKILAEQKEKLKEKKRIRGILDSTSKIWSEVKGELEEIGEKFGDKRRSKITTAAATETKEYNIEDFIEEEDAFLVVSQNGWLRKLKSLGDPTTLRFKENDALLCTVRAHLREPIAFFTNFGMVYVQKMYSLPYTRSGFGDPVQNFFKFGDGERIIEVLSLDPRELGIAGSEAMDKEDKQQALKFDAAAEMDELELMAASSSGYGFRFPLSNLTETTRSGRRVMTLKGDNRMLCVARVTGDHVFLASDRGKGLVITLEDVTRLSGSGTGVKLMKLVDAKLAGCKCVSLKDSVDLLLEDGKTRSVAVNSLPVYSRGSQGVFISKRKNIVKVI
ncbi:MAG: DNA topoisomerase [Nitrospinae bacterium CG11_big_fil_rev_8_21_14_0_20_56_8]|nr:MAG: DNA topoisomerase [Nitrospinae bacterium CG11_big_fil_rev_8_21_14_0_20_56_8]